MKNTKKIENALIGLSVICGLNTIFGIAPEGYRVMEIIGKCSLILLCLLYLAKLKYSPYSLSIVLLAYYVIVTLFPWINIKTESWMYHIGASGFIVYALLQLRELFINKTFYRNNNIFFYALILGLIAQVCLRIVPDLTGTYTHYANLVNYLIVGMIGTIRMVPDKEPNYKPGIIEGMNIIGIIALVDLLKTASKLV